MWRHTLPLYSDPRRNEMMIYLLGWLFLNLFTIRLPGGNSRFPRVEDMPHFHYDFVDLGEAVKVSWTVFHNISLGNLMLLQSKFSEHTLVRPKWTALLTAALTKSRLNSKCSSYKLCIHTYFRKQPAPVVDTFYASRGCPRTGALTVFTIETKKLFKNTVKITLILKGFHSLPKQKLTPRALVLVLYA